MCIVCFWLIVSHPCPGLWCHFTQIPRHRHRFISFSFPFLFVCECDVFDLLSAVCLPPSLHATKPSGTCDTIDRTEANCCLTFGKSRTSLSSPISLPSLPPRGDRRADMEITPPSLRRVPFLSEEVGSVCTYTVYSQGFGPHEFTAWVPPTDRTQTSVGALGSSLAA